MPAAKPPPFRRAPRGVSAEQVKDRSRGALLGLATGDALGATHEGKQFLTPDFSIFLEGMQTEMLGGGPFTVVRGQVTGKTQMACCLAASLRELRRFEMDDVVERYLKWMKDTFDISEQVKTVLELIQAGMLPKVASHDHWVQNAKRAASNTSLMRTAPIGVFFAKDRTARVRASLDESAITHYDPRCRLACVALNAAIAAAITSIEEPKPDKMVAAALTELTLAAAMLGQEAIDVVRDVKSALDILKRDIELAQSPDPELYGPDLFLSRNANWVRVALRLAFWELTHAGSLEQALIDVVNRGGDTATNGAIVGALLGARFGENGVPEEWRFNVLEALINKEGLLVDTYHPNQLLQLAD
jgi:ADP-ribosyl-[dinitrogen reductase] hydrolase